MKTFQYNEASAPAPPNAINEIVFYDSIMDLPMFRLNEFQIHLSQDAGIGSTLMDWDKRMEGIDTALAAGDVPTAQQERYNSRLGLFLLLDGVSTTARCLADLVYAINGVPIADFSEDGLMQVHRRIMERLTAAEAAELVGTLKKKFKRQLKTGFPSLFPDDEELQFYASIVRRALLQIEDVQRNIELPDVAFEHSPEVNEINKWLRDQMKPENFDFSDPQNAVDAKRRDFEQVCTALAMAGIQNAENLTAFKFHSRIQYINEHQRNNHGTHAETNPYE